MNENKKVIEVTCAIIESEGRVLAAQRGENMSLPLKWEFPGGKVEPGEKPEDSIVREIKEELDLKISIRKELRACTHDYGSKVIKLIPFLCSIEDGVIKCREHKDVLWGNTNELIHLDWAEADIAILKDYIDSI